MLHPQMLISTGMLTRKNLAITAMLQPRSNGAMYDGTFSSITKGEIITVPL